MWIQPGEVTAWARDPNHLQEVNQWTITRGTHGGAIFGMSPTGKAVAVPGMTMVRITDGRPHESWAKNDVASLMKQLGAS
jgi:predicted ester cyclase